MLGSGYVLQADPVPAGGLPPPDFELPLNDLGAGAVETGPSRGVGPATFTRATAAASKLSTGLWKLDVASGVARSSYIGLTTAVGAYGGYLAEGARTNSCLQSRDMTNASWTKTTMTTAQTSTGIDGVGNSCTRLTATAGNALSTQAIVLASAAKTYSVWIKRVTGTGTVQISLDNFATNTDVTSLINSVTFTLVQMTQTLANPTVGIRLVTNTDAVDVDMSQLEDGVSFASTPIPTTVAAVTRNIDALTYSSTVNVNAVNFSIYCEGVFYNATSLGADQGIFALDDGATNRSEIDRFNASADFAYRGQGLNTDTGLAVGTSAFKLAARVATADLAVVLNAGTPYTNAGGAALGAHTTLRIAQSNLIGNNPMFGMIKSVRIWQRQLPNATLQAITA